MPDIEASAATLTRKAIADEVRAELARQSKTQRDLGEILGLPQSAISLRLAGDRPFRGEELALLAGRLGVPVEQFLRVSAAQAPLADAPVAGAA